MPAEAAVADFADIDLSAVKVDAKGLPDYVPQSNLNNNMLMTLKIYELAKEKSKEIVVRPKSYTITGHVDSGKSTITVLMLGDMGVIEPSKFEVVEKEAAEKAQRLGGEDSISGPNFAKIVEKGKEAQERGVTIETKAWQGKIKCPMRVKTDSDNHKQAIAALKAIEWDYEEKVDGDITVVTFWETSLLVDAPGHKNYIHNTAAALNECQVQFVLFPNSSAEGIGEQEDPFDRAMGPESLSVAHSRLGIFAGNTMVFLLSKCDMATVESTKSRVETLETKLPVKVGLKKENLLVIPVASKGRTPHNLLQHSDYEKVSFWKGQKRTLSIEDYKDHTKRHNVPLDVTYAMQVLHAHLPSISRDGSHNNMGGMAVIKSKAMLKCGQIIVCIINSGTLRVGKTYTSVLMKEDFSIESMEQFNKPYTLAGTGAHIGMKIKPVKKGGKVDSKNLKVGDMLYADFPADNTPLACQYMKVRIQYHKQKSKGKKKEGKMMYMRGHQHVFISGSRHSIIIVNILKHHIRTIVAGKPKMETVVASAENPIEGVDDNCGLQAYVKFTGEVALPTVTQAIFGHTGPLLDHHMNVGTLKIDEHVQDATGIDLIEAAHKSKKGAAKK